MEQSGAHGGGEGMQLGLGKVTPDFPQCRKEMDRISQKTEIEHDDFFRPAGALEKRSGRRAKHAELLAAGSWAGNGKSGGFSD